MLKTLHHPLLVFFFLSLAGFLGLYLEKKKHGAKISAAVMAIVFGFVLSNIGLLPETSVSYDFIWSYILPLSIPFFLFRANLFEIYKSLGSMLLAFVLGAVGTVLGTLMATQLVPLDGLGPKIAAVFSASYIGGSVNFVSTAKVINLTNANILSAGTAADNLLMALYFLILFYLANNTWFMQTFMNSKKEDSLEASSNTAKTDTLLHLKAEVVLPAFVLSSLFCALGLLMASLIGQNSSFILWTTLFCVLAASFFPKQIQAYQESDQIGLAMMQIFFALIGASAKLSSVLEHGLPLLLFIAIIIIVHMLCIVIGGKLFKLDPKVVLLASNANTGGPTTAVAMAGALKWENYKTAAVLAGTLGYAIATFVGASLFRVLQ